MSSRVNCSRGASCDMAISADKRAISIHLSVQSISASVARDYVLCMQIANGFKRSRYFRVLSTSLVLVLRRGGDDSSCKVNDQFAARAPGSSNVKKHDFYAFALTILCSLVDSIRRTYYNKIDEGIYDNCTKIRKIAIAAFCRMTTKIPLHNQSPSRYRKHKASYSNFSPTHQWDS